MQPPIHPTRPTPQQPRIDASLPSSSIALPEDDVDDELEAICIPEYEASAFPMLACIRGNC